MEVKKRQLILVHVLSGGYRCDYQIFDLEAEKVLKTGIQSSLNPGGDGDVVVSGTSIYNIGGLRHSIDEDFPCLDNFFEKGDEHIHLGASCLELNIDEEDVDEDANRWKVIPPMKDFRVYPSCASLGGKVYALGSLSLEDDVSIGEVFQDGTWKRLLPPIENMVMSVSPHVISDEKNARLLVHICNISCLYAYYPDMATWECLMPHFTAWYPSTKALFDDVLFYHLPESSTCFIAFDLSTKIWLKVKYSSNFPRQAISFCEWEGLLHLGNDIMCLASYCPFGDPVHTNICFLKFRVERISSHELLLTFVSSQSFPFEGRLTAYRFLLLP